jgi:hypothetical protein
MEREYDVLGKPGIFRNDRFWIVGDHVVDPRIKDNPTVKEMVAGIERARDDFKMTEYQGTNVRDFRVPPNHFNAQEQLV